MTDPRLEVSFSITGFLCSPEDVTQRLGISPSSTWREGDTVQRSQIRRKFNGWVLQSDVADSMDLERHVQSLLDRLPPNLGSLSDLTPRWEAEVSCAVYVSDQTPVMALDAMLIRRLGQLEAGVDIDLYVLP